MIRSQALKVYDKIRFFNSRDAVFIWIPKTAGTSVNHALKQSKLTNLFLVKFRFAQKGRVSFGHMKYRDLVDKGHISAKFDDTSYKFCFVRNPYDRAVSLYFYLKKMRLIEDRDFKGFVHRLNREKWTPIGLYNNKNLSICNPQIEWVRGLDLDFIGRVERLDQDLQFVLWELGLEMTKLEHLNGSNSRDYREMYDSELQRTIYDMYKEDFEVFDYSKHF